MATTGKRERQRTRSLHIQLSEAERRGLNILIADEGKKACDVVRPVLIDYVDRELKARGLDGARKKKPRESGRTRGIVSNSSASTDGSGRTKETLNRRVTSHGKA